jgi:hypothetical protein
MAWHGSPGLATVKILQAQCGQLARLLKQNGMLAHSHAFVDLHSECVIYEPVDPISLSQLIVSQSQLLPSFWPVIGAKLPLILALLCARAPTQRPERLQENVIERPFMHPQSQRSIPRVYLYRLRSIHLNSSVSHHIHCERNLLLHRQCRPSAASSAGSRTATNFADAFALFRFYHDQGFHRNGSAMFSTIEQCVSCEV